MVPSQVAVITGASKHLGKALAIGLSRAGYAVVLAGRNKAELDEIIPLLTGPFLTVEHELVSFESSQNLINLTMQTFGRLDILLNNASVWNSKNLAQTEVFEINTVYDIMIKGTTYLTKLAYTQMANQLSGHIFQFLPLHILDGLSGASNSSYFAAKFALHGLTEALRKEAKLQGVKLTSLYLGEMDSDGGLDDPVTPESRLLSVKSVVKSVLFALAQNQEMCVEKMVLGR